MRRSLRVAVLECDTLIDPILKKQGNYGELYRALLQLGLHGLGFVTEEIELNISKWDVVRTLEYPDPERVDGILVSGSKLCAYGEEPWILSLIEYIQNVFRSSSIPLVGVCFGHQIIARALGAKLERSTKGWELSVEPFKLSEAGSQLFGQSSLAIQHCHHDIVVEVPQQCFNLGSSPKCDVQGLYMPNRIFTLQAHPEFNSFHMTEILTIRHAQGRFSDEDYHNAMARVNRDTDSLAVARVVCELFLNGGREA